MRHPEVRLDHACVPALEEVEGGRPRQVERGVADTGDRCRARQLLLRLGNVAGLADASIVTDTLPGTPVLDPVSSN